MIFLREIKNLLEYIWIFKFQELLNKYMNISQRLYLVTISLTLQFSYHQHQHLHQCSIINIYEPRLPVIITITPPVQSMTRTWQIQWFLKVTTVRTVDNTMLTFRSFMSCPHHWKSVHIGEEGRQECCVWSIFKVSN